MKKSLKILLFLILIALNIRGQTIRFNKTYDFYGGWEFGNSIFEVDDGYIVGGAVRDSASNSYCIGLLKIDSVGNIIWKKSFCNSGENYIVWSLIQADDGNFLATGFHETMTDSTCYLVKFDGNGDTTWIKEYSAGNYMYGYQVKQTSDKGFIITGKISNIINSSEHLLLKTDSLGTEEWRVSYPQNISHVGRSVATTSDGGYITSGRYTSGGNFFDRAIKTDNLGNIQWTYSVSGFISTVLTDDAGFIWGCGAKTNIEELSFIFKFNNAGVIQFEKTYGKIEAIGNGLYNIKQLSDGNFIAAGSFNESSTVYNFDGFLLKINSQGDSLWSRSFELTGDNNQDMFADVIPTQDGGFAIAGWFFPNYQDMWVVKTDSMGCDTVGCHLVGVEEDQLTSINLNIFPNPVHDNIIIEWFLPQGPQTATLKIINLMGQTVINQNIVPANNTLKETLNLDKLPPGLYLLTLTAGEKTISRKFIKQ